MEVGRSGILELISRIESPALIDVARHWNQVRAQRRMPAWRDLDAIEIASHLPIVWSWRYDRASDTFTGRLIGQAITDLFGNSIRNKRMEDYFDANDYRAVYERCYRVVMEPCFSRDIGRIFSYREDGGTGERILMPLAEDGENGDGIFGATAYDLAQHQGGKVGYATGALEYLPL